MKFRLRQQWRVFVGPLLLYLSNQMEQLITDYYKERGWNEKGEPPKVVSGNPIYPWIDANLLQKPMMFLSVDISQAPHSLFSPVLQRAWCRVVLWPNTGRSCVFRFVRIRLYPQFPHIRHLFLMRFFENSTDVSLWSISKNSSRSDRCERKRYRRFSESASWYSSIIFLLSIIFFLPKLSVSNFKRRPNFFWF